MLLYILTKLSILVKVLLKQNFFFVCSVLVYTFVTSNKNRIFAPLFSPVPCDGKLGSKITNFE